MSTNPHNGKPSDQLHQCSCCPIDKLAEILSHRFECYKLRFLDLNWNPLPLNVIYLSDQSRCNCSNLQLNWSPAERQRHFSQYVYLLSPASDVTICGKWLASHTRIIFRSIDRLLNGR